MKSDVKQMSQYEWLLLIILSIVWGCSFFFVGAAVEELPPLTIAALRVSLATIALLAVVHLSGLRMPSKPTIWVALISTAFAYILYFRISSTAGATNLQLVTLLIPVSAILLVTALLGEQLELKHVVGMGLISIGLLSIDGRAVQIISRILNRKTSAQL